MKANFNTSQLQNLVTKAVKGASNNKLLPLTSLMSVDYDGNGKLSLTTTDYTNYLIVSASDISMSDDEIHAVVSAETFAKLVSKMTSESVTIEQTDEFLHVSGGKSDYKIEIALDVDGSAIVLKAPEFKAEVNQSVKLASVKNILATAKSALATELKAPCYTAYYVGDNILSTDSYRVCAIREKLLDKPVLVRADTMDLLDIAESDLKCGVDGESLRFVTDDGTFSLTTKVNEGIESYAVDALNQFVNSEFDAKCTMRKNDLLQALDRLVLFVSDYDRNTINLLFDKDSLTLTNKKNAGKEVVEYSGDKTEKLFECAINIEFLVSQIKAHPNDDITISYGLPNCIKIESGDVTQIIALCNE